MEQKKYPVKKGDIYQFEIEKLAFGGAGVARLDNYVVFIKGALPGECVKAKVYKRKRSYAEARLQEIVHRSTERIEAPCPFFEWCGGCTWQNLSYEHQLKYKEAIVGESLHHIGGLEKIGVNEVIPSSNPFAYRNKMEFSFSDRRWLLPHELGDDAISRDFALGLHVPGAYDKILHIDHCLLQSETANEILRFIQEYARTHHLAAYGIKSHQGFLRFLVIRQSSYTQKLMINIVTAYKDVDSLRPLADQLIKKWSQVESVVNNINTRPAQIAVGEEEILLAGKAEIKEKLGPFEFSISANSFFQTNTMQAQRLYDIVIQFAGLQSDDVVWDLYAGTGTISLFLAQKANYVIGFESAESAVADARRNAAEHGLPNTSFIAGDLLKTLNNAQSNPDVIVTDPPRAGMHKKVIEAILQSEARTVVYVSCNPTTMARDLNLLSAAYRIIEVQPLDMFPQTYHIETVAQLKRKSKKPEK
ncbi:MAG: 23S rRNA (uracil(1939)-C(5))-methyltransferase RlmD [Caldithrix sp.]|nr:23S rRNA (uracil(1939)-C(5))-methyltransferase RlmD [Caldithrix sp.]